MFDTVVYDSVPRPVPEGLVVFNSEYVAKEPLQLKCVEGKTKKEAFTIASATGHLMFKMHASMMSMHDDKKMEDAHGRPVFTMRSKLISMHKAIRIYWPGSKDDAVFEAKKSSSMTNRKMRIKTRVTDLTTRKELPVCILGDLHGTNAVMLLGEQSKGHVIANLRNAHNVTSNLSGVQDYDIQVAAGVDTALIAALAVIFHQCVSEKKDGGSSSASSSDNEAAK